MRSTILTVILFCCVCGAPLQAQRIVPNGKLILNLDYSRYQYTDSSGYLEFYYAFYPKLLTLDRTASGWVGGISLNTSITEVAKGSVVKHVRSYIPVLVADTSSLGGGSSFATTTGYEVRFGDYTVTVRATDSLDQSRSDSVTFRVTVQPYRASITSSDLELCSSVRESKNSADPFFKNNVEAVPNPSLVFGSSSSPMLMYYLELYNVVPQKHYTVRSSILDANQKEVKKIDRQRTYAGANAVEVGSLNVASLPSSRYRIVVAVLDESNTELSNTAKTFFIFNPHLAPAQGSESSAGESVFAGMTMEELALEFKTAQYTATDQELKTFATLTSIDGRKTFLAKFWREVEAGRFSKPAISRVEYLRRVSVANQRYRAIGREGWHSDRGRIFILYGEPDEVERFPSSDNKKPYETWHYYQIENGVLFTFVDRSMFGDYTLVNSTKRGELRDDQWERLLQ